MNAAPEFAGMDNYYMVAEADTLDIVLDVTDIELNTITVASAETYTGITYSYATNELAIEYLPTYGDEGSYEFIFTATDEYGASNDVSIFVEVVHTNQAPEFIGISTFDIDGIDSYTEYNFADYFTDPDGDEMVFSAISDDTTVSEAFATGSKFVVKTISEGTGTLTLVAIDTYSAATTQIVDVTVTDNSLGIESDLAKAGVDVFPNPTTDYININFTIEIADDVSITLVDVTGKTLQNLSVDNNSSSIQLDVKDLPTGLYFLTIKGTDLDQIAKIIKK
jgi:hypothetical protein